MEKICKIVYFDEESVTNAVHALADAIPPGRRSSGVCLGFSRDISKLFVTKLNNLQKNG